MKLRTHQMFKLLALGAIASSLYAQDFYWNTTSARSQAVGGGLYPLDVGRARCTRPRTRRGLSTLTARTVDLSVTSIFSRGNFSNSVNQNAPLQNSPGVLPYGGFGMPVAHSRFTVGVGLVPELMSVSNWNYVDAPGVAGVTHLTTNPEVGDYSRVVRGCGQLLV